MDRKGERMPNPAEPLSIGYEARLSKDARRVAMSVDGSRGEVSNVMVDLERGVRTAVGDPATTLNYGVLWAPNDQGIITYEVRDGQRSIVNSPIGAGTGTRLLEGQPGFEYAATSVTPDGNTLIFTQSPLRNKTGDIMTLNLGRDEPAKTFMKTPDPEWSPRLSPSDDVVAYTVFREEDVGATLIVVAYPTPFAPVQVSATPIAFGGYWWLSASELAWIDTTQRMWSATITSNDGRIDVGVPKPLFDGKPLDKQIRISTTTLPRTGS